MVPYSEYKRLAAEKNMLNGPIFSLCGPFALAQHLKYICTIYIPLREIPVGW